MSDKPYSEVAAEPLGLVRSLIPDIEQLPNPVDPSEEDSYIFSDATLTGYLMLSNQSIKRAAALACITLAGSELLILKKITTDDLVTDGAAVAKEHRERANVLNAQAAADDDADDDSGSLIVAGGRFRRPVPFDAERAFRRRF